MKKIPRRIVQVVTIGCIISAMTISAFATVKTLSVTRYTQEKTKWCWAACAQMIGKYKTGTKRSQSNICEYVKGVVENAAGTVAETTTALWLTTGKDTNYKNSYLKFSTSKGQINDSRPFIVRIKKDSGGGHMLVASGYKTEPYYYLRLIDPVAGCGTNYYRYHNMTNSGETFNSCSGVWSHTVYIVKGS